MQKITGKKLRMSFRWYITQAWKYTGKNNAADLLQVFIDRRKRDQADNASNLWQWRSLCNRFGASLSHAPFLNCLMRITKCLKHTIVCACVWISVFLWDCQNCGDHLGINRSYSACLKGLSRIRKKVFFFSWNSATPVHGLCLVVQVQTQTPP